MQDSSLSPLEIAVALTGSVRRLERLGIGRLMAIRAVAHDNKVAPQAVTAALQMIERRGAKEVV